MPAAPANKPLPPRPWTAMPNGDIELQHSLVSVLSPGNSNKPLPPSPPLRPSLEEAYRDSSDDSENEDVDEFDPLNYDGGTLKRKKEGLSRRNRRNVQDTFGEAGKGRSTVKAGWQRWLIPSKFGCFLISLFFACTFLLLAAGGFWAYTAAPTNTEGTPWNQTKLGGTDPAWADAYAKASKMIANMTLTEKINITTGIGWQMGMCVGNTGPVERLGFPSLCLQDGPLGIRFARNISVFPAGITAGATWNKDLIYKRGRALGNEAKLKGVNVLLGPAVGPLGRTPLGGRVWEGFGADPVLQGMMAAETIKGIQEEHVMATVKHFVGNEQEHFRKNDEETFHPTEEAISSNIDERTLHEMYAWPFQDAIKAGVASVMCSYQQVNNSYACQNDRILNGILKDEFGFQGFVQSDWLAQRSGVASALSGLDMSMPGDGLYWADGDSLWGSKLTMATMNGSVPLVRLNDMVSRIVASWYYVGQDNKANFTEGGPNFSSWTQDEVGHLYEGSGDGATGVVNKFVDAQGEGEAAHKNVARQVAAEGIVLVKNEGNVLPLTRTGGRPKTQGQKFKVSVIGEDSHNMPNGPNWCVDRGCNKGTLATGWGSGSAEFPYLTAPDEALIAAFDNNSVEIVTWPGENIPNAQKDRVLHEQDLCIVFANADSGEGYVPPTDAQRGDRNDLKLAHYGMPSIKMVAQECGGDGSSPTIVVLHTVGPVEVEQWIDLPGVKAVLFAHLPGQESGNALVDVLFGDVDASGRLPYTVGKKLEDYGPSAKIMMVPEPADKPQQNFDEGLYIDYRWFDKKGIEPRYPFGHGLSYTTWKLSSLMIQPNMAFEFGRTRLLPPPTSNTTVPPPTYNETLPTIEEILYPKAFRKVNKYIYPYLENFKEVFGDMTGRKSIVLNNATALPGTSYGYQGGHPGLFEEMAEIRATLTNTGKRDGSCVVQLYVEFPQNYVDPDTNKTVDFPVKVLRNFQKIFVPKGDQHGDRRAEVKMSLTRKDLSYWSEVQRNWVLPEKGDFRVKLGFSSRDLAFKMDGVL